MKRVISLFVTIVLVFTVSAICLADTHTGNGYGTGSFSNHKQNVTAYARLANYWFISASSYNSSGSLLDYNDHDDMPMRLANYSYYTDYHLSATNGTYTVGAYSSTGHVGFIGGDYGSCP